MRKAMRTLTVFLALYLVVYSNASGQERPSAAKILEEILFDSGIQTARQKFGEMTTSNKEDYHFDEEEFIASGFKLQVAGKVKAASAMYKMNTELFPRSARAWIQLAQVYTLLVDKKKATECYEQILTFDPDNGVAREELNWLDPRIDDARHETKIARRFASGEHTGLTGPYMGQNPPGLIPEKFAPGIVSTYGAREIGCTFSDDGKAFYFKRSGVGVMVSYWREDGWTAPELTNIQGGEMFIWPGDGHMYLNVRVPAPEGSEQRMLFGIGRLEKMSNGWGKPDFLVPGMFVTIADNGTLYTSWFFENGFDVIKYPLVNGQYNNHEILSPAVNSREFDAHPCVAPDESFLIFDSTREGSHSFSDLYVSFRDEHGEWTNAVNFGEQINLPGISQCPMLSHDGKYLFWNLHNDIYWVDAGIIDQLRPVEE